jgi:hypothetical protein
MWKTTPTLHEDNEPFWGAPVYLEQQQSVLNLYGQERDSTSNTFVAIRPNPLVFGDSFKQGFFMAQVYDPGGPNHQYWYIQLTTIYIDQETVINQHIKSYGPPPFGGPNFYNYNNGRCINSAAFVRAVMGHENSGVGPGATGHYGLLVAALQNLTNDPRTAIEKIFATHAEGMTILGQRTTDELSRIESALLFARDPNHLIIRGNWFAKDKYALWISGLNRYSDCIVGHDF